MTWQGGKTRREEVTPTSPFAPLKAIAGERDDPAKGLQSLGRALSEYPKPLSLLIRLVGAEGDESVEDWEVQAGAKNPSARRKEPKNPDVIVVMRPETWMQIAQGQLAPYDALYSGRLRVGGDLEAAKELTQHLTDPASPYVQPC
jgi:hypothetical protein